MWCRVRASDLRACSSLLPGLHTHVTRAQHVRPRGRVRACATVCALDHLPLPTRPPTSTRSRFDSPGVTAERGKRSRTLRRKRPRALPEKGASRSLTKERLRKGNERGECAAVARTCLSIVLRIFPLVHVYQSRCDLEESLSLAPLNFRRVTLTHVVIVFF